MVPARYETVPISRIDPEDLTFSITTQPLAETLTESIRHVGVINPPIVMENGSRLSIVSGFRRCAACRYLAFDSIRAGILDAGTSKLECVKLAISDNAFQRPLNLVEYARAFHLLSEFYGDADELAHAASILGIAGSKALVEKLLPLIPLPSPVLDCIADEIIPLPIAVELTRLSPEAAELISKWFDVLRPGLNKQREIITLAKEIALREDLRIPEVLNVPELQSLLADDSIDRNRKTGQLRAYLKNRRYPALTAAEEAFGLLARKLDTGAGIRLAPPPHFESSVFTLNLTFQDIDEFSSRLKAVTAMGRDPIFVKLLAFKKNGKFVQ